MCMLFSPFEYDYYKHPDRYKCVKFLHNDDALQQANCGYECGRDSASQISKNAVAEDLPYLKSAIQKTREALWNAKDKGFVKPENFEVLDFNMGDARHGWNPLHLTENKVVSNPYSIVGPYSDPLVKREVENISLMKNSGAFMTLRRYKYSKRGDRDILYLVIPMIDEKKCLENGVENLGFEVSKNIVTDKAPLNGCYLMKDGSINLFLQVIYRLRVSESDKWDMEPRFLATPSLNFVVPN